MGNNAVNRAGDTSQRCGNSPAVYVSSSFAPYSQPPEVATKKELLARFAAQGFTDTDSPQAFLFMDRIGYTHAKPYASAFANKGFSLSTVELAIGFDRRFQSMLLEYIGLFEVQFRTQYSRLMSEHGGAFAHRAHANFKNRAWYEASLENYMEEANRQSRQKNEHVRASMNRYGDLPVWEAIEVMSMGTLSKFYKNTRSKRVRFGVADSFGVRYEELVSWIGTISFVRNRCAHFGRLLGTKLVTVPKPIPNVELSTDHPLYAMLILVKLLSADIKQPDNTAPVYSLGILSDFTNIASDYEGPIAATYLPPNWKQLISRADIVSL